MSLLPPGRFLMPGNLAGSPALTFAPLDLPDRRQRAGGIAVGDDGAALRGLQGRRGAAVLPRSFRAARSPGRAGRCARGVQLPDRKRCTISKRRWPEFSIASGSAAARCSAACSGRGSTASCLPPPRPIICIIPAMIGSKRCCGEPWPRRADARRIHRRRDRRGGAGRGARHPRGAGRARPRKTAVDPRARRRRAKSPMARPSTARPKSRLFPATCPPIPKQLFDGDDRVSRPDQRQRRKSRFSLSAVSAAAARARRRR